MTQAQKNYLKSIELLGEQIKQSYFEAKKLIIPKNYGQVNKIVTCGMGGSQLGVDLVRQLFADKIKLPIIQVRGYNLPKFIDNKTLVFLISYSGSTEEVLSVAKIVRRLPVKIIVISTGGQLSELAVSSKFPTYLFKPINNPSKQPRTGIGYIIGSILAIFQKVKAIEINDGLIMKMVEEYYKNYQKIKKSALLNKISQKIKNKIPVIVASEFLQGNSHIMANQINESAKQLAIYFSLPELNHHLLEGLTFPPANKKNLYFIFFFSKNYHLRNQKRYYITQKVLQKQKIPFYQIKLSGDKISQAMAMLTIGIQLSYKLSQVNRVDPNQVPWVKFFKQILEKK